MPAFLCASDVTTVNINAMWNAVPERQRAAIVLRFYEDLSDVQTAEILQCSPGTVRSRLHYGLEALRAALESDARA